MVAVRVVRVVAVRVVGVVAVRVVVVNDRMTMGPVNMSKELPPIPLHRKAVSLILLKAVWHGGCLRLRRVLMVWLVWLVRMVNVRPVRVV